MNGLNRFDLAEAKRRLKRALQLDSTFALAHYKLAIVAQLQGQADSVQQQHAIAAVGLSAGLPARGCRPSPLLFVSGDFVRACSTYGALARADSSDIEALYGLAECLYRDGAVEPTPGDSTTLRFRTSWNSALRAYKRILVVDPGYHLAFERIMDLLSARIRTGRAMGNGTPQTRRTVDANGIARSVDILPSRAEHPEPIGIATATPIRRGDTLVTIPLVMDIRPPRDDTPRLVKQTSNSPKRSAPERAAATSTRNTRSLASGSKQARMK